MADKQQRNPFTLFDLRDEIKVIVADIVDADIVGDTDEVESLLEELDALHDRRSDKLVGYIHVIKNAIAGSENCYAQADEFTKRGRALKNLAQNLKFILLGDLREHEEEVVNAGVFKIARHATHTPSVKVNIFPEELPEKYQDTKIVANTDALRTALKAGEEIDGVKLGDTEHVRIKII